MEDLGLQGRIDQLLVQSDVGAWADEEYREIHCPAASGPGYGGQMGIDYISDFCAAAAEGTPFISSGKDALRAMQFVEAAYTSAGSGHRVELI